MAPAEFALNNISRVLKRRLAIVLGFPSGGPRFESWGDASGFTPVVRGFLRIGGLLFGVTKVVVTAGGAIAVLTDPHSTNLTPPVPKKNSFSGGENIEHFQRELICTNQLPFSKAKDSRHEIQNNKSMSASPDSIPERHVASEHITKEDVFELS
ncbi:hypothetical protein LXL04_004612 [Taraxacum kok-saghyz]